VADERKGQAETRRAGMVSTMTHTSAEGIILDLAKGLCPNEDYYYEHKACEGCPFYDPNDGRTTFESGGVKGAALVTNRDDGSYLYCAARWVDLERETHGPVLGEE
jgi:hypothetical protein